MVCSCRVVQWEKQRSGDASVRNGLTALLWLNTSAYTAVEPSGDGVCRPLALTLFRRNGKTSNLSNWYMESRSQASRHAIFADGPLVINFCGRSSGSGSGPVLFMSNGHKGVR